MSGSPLLRTALSPGSRHSPRIVPLDSPVRPRVLAPLFANAVDSEPRSSPGSKQQQQQQQGSPQLQLVPKNVAMLASSGRGRENLLKMVDPRPEWTLDDLRDELNSLEEKLSSSRKSKPGSEPRVYESSPNAGMQRFALDDEVAADFKRPSRPFIMRLDSDDDEVEDEDEDDEEIRTETAALIEQQSSKSSPEIERRRSGGAEEFLPVATGKVEAAIFEADRLRLLRVQEELRQKRSKLESAFLEASQLSAEKIAQVVKEAEQRCEMTRRIDKQYQRTVAEQRDKHLSALQRDHEQRSLLEERKIKKEEEAQRREVAVREEMERQLKAKADAEKLAAAKAVEAERLKVAEAQRAELDRKAAAQRAEAEKRQAEMDQKALKRSEGPIVKVAKEAADAEHARKKVYQELHDASQALQTNPVSQKNLKLLGYQISKILNQVSATEEQVSKKSMELLHLVTNPQIQTFVVSTLASKLMSQCETQVARVPSYAFVFARIIVNVSNQVPVVMDAVISQLNANCIFTVPKYFMYNKANYESDKSYYKILGYREDETGKLETADDFVARMSAYVTLYAAITQIEENNRHGISNGWKWCAQLLNHLPANRYTASALYAFFETAGFRLHQNYPNPFMKLMHSVVTKFVPLLQKQNDSDARAILNRLETYLITNQFRKRPDDQLSQHIYSTTISLQEGKQ